jgi:uncharacterized caspase-like protein
VAKLQNARTDARAMAEALGRTGYKVRLRTDLGERAMKDELRAFKAEIQGGDEVLFYFAGHGVQLSGANYLLPTDIRGEAEDQVRDDALLLQKVLDDLQERKARFSLAIVDACRRVPISSRGEFELPEAVGLALREGVPVRAVCLSAPVLDLSRRTDIAGVVDRLSSIEPHP